MRMIPPTIRESTRSNAERRLFELFRSCNLGTEYHCLHSVDLPDHIYKLSGEIDFLIISPNGIYVLEVKGGGVSCHNGIWEYEDRLGQTHRSSEGPFHQAESAMYTLRDKLALSVGKLRLETLRSPFSDLVFGYGVALLDTVFDVSGLEWDSRLILDARRLQHGGITQYLLGLESYWQNKLGKGHLSVHPNLPRQVLKAVRPDFERVPSLNVQAQTIEGRLVSLTEEQYSRLDIIEENARILVSGGAGTGKTFLAMEVARRHAAAGQQVLLLCFSPLLATFLKSQVSDPLITVSGVHELMLTAVGGTAAAPPGYRIGMLPGDEWYLQSLLPAFGNTVRSASTKGKYDVLVIDEAQDILNLDYLSAIGYMLKGGLEAGCWRVFYDPFNQGAIFGVMDQTVIAMLRTLGAVPARLRINCRNTNQIVLQTRLLTGADLGMESTGPGPSVRFGWFQGNADAVGNLERYLTNLLERDIALSDVTILSPRPFENSTACGLSAHWQKRITILGGAGNAAYPARGLSYATVAEFKGLENRYVAFIDLDDLDSTAQAKAILYVGMSRARVALWMAIDKRLRSRIEEVSKQNVQQVLEDLDHDR